MSLVGLYLTFIYNKEAKPTYSIISDEVLIGPQSNKQVKIFYDSIQIENIRVAKIVIWNSGNSFIDKNDITDDHSICIKSEKAVNILEVRFIKATRKELGFTVIPPLYSSKKLASNVKILLQGDEGLEANDGGLFEIVYSFDTTVDWVVAARIKGIPEGFMEEKNNDFGLERLAWLLMLTLVLGFNMRGWYRDYIVVEMTGSFYGGFLLKPVHALLWLILMYSLTILLLFNLWSNYYTLLKIENLLQS